MEPPKRRLRYEPQSIENIQGLESEIKFKLWLENKFMRLPPETERSIDIIVAKVMSGEKTKGPIGTIYVNGRNIPVVMKDLPSHVSADYAVDKDKILPETIFINNDVTTYSQDELKNKLSHEVTHAFDPKITINPRSPGNEPTPEYFQSPTEFDAYGSDVERTLKRFFSNKIIPIQSRLSSLGDLKLWLRTGKASANTNSYFNSPMFNAWRASPPLWKSFRQKLYTTLTDIERDLNKEVKK